MSEYRPLTMRANRLLGASLVEHNLLNFETLESANERLLELMNDDSEQPVSLLTVLTKEMQALSEQQVLHFLVEEIGLGLIDLSHYDQPDELRKKLDIAACWATWSVPFDREEDVHFIATAYYLSPAVRAYWEKEFDGPIQWFATSTEQISDFLRKLQIERENLAAAAAAAVR